MKKYNIHLPPGADYSPQYEGGVYVSYSPEDCGINRINSAGDDNTVWFCHAQPSMGIQFMQLVRAADRGAAGICMLNRNELLIDPFAQDLFKSANEKAFPVMIAVAGAGEKGFKYKPGLPLLENCLQDYKNTKFIVSGSGFWNELVNCDTKPTGTIDYLFGKYPNIYGALSGFCPQTANSPMATELFNRYPDRFFFSEDYTSYASDISAENWLDDMYSTGRLSHEAYKKICCKNAERLIKGEL